MPYYVVDSGLIIGYDCNRGLYSVYNFMLKSNYIKLDNFHIYCEKTNTGLNIKYKLSCEQDLTNNKIEFSNNTISITGKYKDFKLSPIEIDIENINDKFYNLNNNQMILCKSCNEFMEIYKYYNIAYCKYCKEGFRLRDDNTATRKRVLSSSYKLGPIKINEDL